MQLEDLIFSYSTYIHQIFHEKVFRVGLSIGIDCPHRIQTGGCIFCNPDTFTGEYQRANISIDEQFRIAIPRIHNSCGKVKLLAYFQDETSTACSVDFLRRKMDQAMSYTDVVGVVVSTRPDYISQNHIDFFQTLSYPFTLELGLQTVHNKSLNWLQRGHSFEQVDKIINKCGDAGIEIGVHLILGIPSESFEEMRETVTYVSNNSFIKQIKLHNLVVYKNTLLEQMMLNKKCKLLSIKEYIELLSELIPHIKGDKVISRLFTSNIRRTQVALNHLEGNKTKWMNWLRLLMEEKKYKQGSKTALSYKKM